MTAAAGDAHLDLDTLAELDEGLLPTERAATAEEHLLTCTVCAHEAARLRTTRALLSALPDEPMPAAVAQRVDDALHSAAGPATVVPAPRQRRRWNTAALAGAAAATAVLALAGALIYPRVVHRNTQPTGGTTGNGSPGSSVAPPSATLTKEWATGTDYTPAMLAALVPKLVTGSPPATLPGSSGASSTSPAAAHAAPTLADLRASRAAVVQCGRVLAGGLATVPLAVDFASFRGSPAAVFALPAEGHPQFLDVWVVRSTCSASSLDFYFRRVPR